MNTDFHFVLAMDVIVCTAGMGNILRTVLEVEVLWSGLEFVKMVALKIVQGTLKAIQYRDDSLDPIVLTFLQQRNFDHVFQHDNA
jgi:hypothetical protein